jgi:lipoprotein-releasing system ATP-binding protein
MIPDSDNPAVLAEEVRKEFPVPGGSLVILDGVDLAVDRGESVAVMGPSGAGKSTLLHILGTLDSPTSGRVRLLGCDPFSLSASDLADFRNGELGFVFQDHQLLPQCTALENVLIPTLVRPRRSKETLDRARRLLESVGLSDRATYRPCDLSGGERQRVAIARALVNKPSVLLCDEPTGSVDSKTADAVGDCFLGLLQEEKIALVIVTHNGRFAGRFGRVLNLAEGRLVGVKE